MILEIIIQRIALRHFVAKDKGGLPVDRICLFYILLLLMQQLRDRK